MDTQRGAVMVEFHQIEIGTRIVCPDGVTGECVEKKLSWGRAAVVILWSDLEDTPVTYTQRAWDGVLSRMLKVDTAESL